MNREQRERREQEKRDHITFAVFEHFAVRIAMDKKHEPRTARTVRKRNLQRTPWLKIMNREQREQCEQGEIDHKKTFRGFRAFRG